MVLLTRNCLRSIHYACGGHITPVELLTNMGSGVSGMFETCMVAILVAAMCALIREYGGFDALLNWIHKIFHGKKGGQLGMGLLVGAMDIATANNTVAIVMANPIAKKWHRSMESHPKRQPPYWIHFPVSFRESFHMEHRCWWQFLQSMTGWSFLLFRSCRSFLSHVSSA